MWGDIHVQLAKIITFILSNYRNDGDMNADLSFMLVHLQCTAALEKVRVFLVTHLEEGHTTWHLINILRLNWA